MSGLYKVLKVAKSLEKYAIEHSQSWQPGEYARELKHFIGIKKDDSVDLSSPPINSVYEVLEKYSFKGKLNITLGVTASREAKLFINFDVPNARNAKNITRDIQSALLPPINDKLKKLPTPSTDYNNICSTQILA